MPTQHCTHDNVLNSRIPLSESYWLSLQIYDLHIGEVGEHSETGSEDGCPRAETACADCPVNSTCDGNLRGDATCTCLPGLRGSNCDIGKD